MFVQFFVNITLLNVLIAIMGDTYGRVREVERQATLNEQASFIAEYSFLLPYEKIHRAPYFTILTLESSEDDDGSWEGQIGAIKSFFRKKFQDFAEKQEKTN